MIRNRRPIAALLAALPAALPAALLAALLIAAAAGCAARSGSPGMSGSGGATATGSGGSTGTGGASVGCSVAINPVAPTTLTGLSVGTSLRVRAQPMGVVAANAAWVWTATFADGSNVPVSFPKADDQGLAEVVLKRTGSYSIAASFSGQTFPCSGSADFVVEQPGAKTASFVFQLTPPPHSFPAQQLQPMQVLGATPTGNHLLILDGGTHVAVTPKRMSDQAPLPAYVRVMETSSGLIQEGHAQADGSPVNLLLPAGRYDVLIVPDGDVPPILITNQRPTDMVGRDVILDDGVAVTGQLTDAGGAPVVGAKLSLRSGTLPSTIGTSNSTGAFSLRARPGTYGVTISPGPAIPAAEFSIAATPGIPISNGATTMSLRMVPLPTARIGLTVNGAGANARILVEAREPVAGAGMVEIAAGGTTIMRAATMRIRADLPIAANGTVTTGPLPRAHYRATVFAAGAMPMATVTTMDDIDATLGDVNGTMTMAPRVAISGMSTGLASVLAIDDAAPVALIPEAVAAFLAKADPTGVFSLNVNPSRLYRLIVDPPPGGQFARAMPGAVMVSATPIAVPPQALPWALLYAGRVLGPHLEPVGGTLVAAFCASPNPNCVDQTRPIAEAVTTTDGAFRLALPDPGFGP
jgi:hypothetical protein